MADEPELMEENVNKKRKLQSVHNEDDIKSEGNDDSVLNGKQLIKNKKKKNSSQEIQSLTKDEHLPSKDTHMSTENKDTPSKDTRMADTDRPTPRQDEYMHTEDGHTLDAKPQNKKGKRKKKPCLTLQLKSYFKKQSKTNMDCRLDIKQIQGLILYCILRETVSVPPKWCQVAHRKNIKKIVLILLRSVGENDFTQHASCFPFISTELNSMVVPTFAHGTDFAFEHPHESLLSVALSKSQLKKMKKANETDSQEQDDMCKDRSIYMLNTKQLKDNQYPSKCYTPDQDKDDEFIPCVITQVPSSSEHPPVFAMDCEMCLTSEGDELTRISIVDESLNVLYDTFVMPRRPIVDYKTQYSGITAQNLEGITVTLHDVQQEVQRILPHNAILAGHSFEFDLKALKMHHDKIIDTAIIYGDRRGTHFKSALKFLATYYLKKKIQDGPAGHCSIEDAQTCMELVKLKFEKGLKFGIPVKQTEGLFDRLDSESKQCAMIDYPAIAQFHQSGGSHVVPRVSDSEIVSSAANLIKTSEFTWIHFHGAKHFYDGLAKNECSVEAKEEVFKTLDGRVRAVFESIPEDCLALVLLGYGDVTDVLRIQRNPQPMQQELVKAVTEVKKGLCFLKITSKIEEIVSKV